MSTETEEMIVDSKEKLFNLIKESPGQNEMALLGFGGYDDPKKFYKDLTDLVAEGEILKHQSGGYYVGGF